jgi:hypothetical protein
VFRKGAILKCEGIVKFCDVSHTRTIYSRVVSIFGIRVVTVHCHLTVSCYFGTQDTESFVVLFYDSVYENICFLFLRGVLLDT